MNSIHLVLQGKGGVGKSLIAVLLAQFFQRNGGKVICADTDPVNRTFTRYTALDVAAIDIAVGGIVNTKKFDPLMTSILSIEADFVIDNGAATFMPLNRYLVENDVFKIMAEHGKKVFIHSVLVGGQAQSDTYDGLAQLIDNVGDSAQIIIWENEFWGKVEFDSVSIRGSKLFKEADKAGKIAGVVKIIDRKNSDTFPEDVKKMSGSNLTLAQVMASDDFDFWEKSRLKMVVGDIFAELDKVEW